VALMGNVMPPRRGIALWQRLAKTVGYSAGGSPAQKQARAQQIAERALGIVVRLSGLVDICGQFVIHFLKTVDVALDLGLVI
jgi:hypothetical protein